MTTPGDFWLSSGHHLCDRDAAGRLVPTPDLWRAFLARPELVPPEEACAAELALHTGLLAAPLRAVPAGEVAALADADARENWQVFLGFRDRVQAEPTLEAAWLALFRGSVAGIPPLFLQMLTHLVARAALEGVGDPSPCAPAEAFFRTQRAAIHPGALLLADEEFLDARAGDGDLGAIGRLLTEAGAPPREVELEVLSEANAAEVSPRGPMRTTWRSTSPRAGRASTAWRGRWRASSAMCWGSAVTIRPVPVIDDRNWSWHVGLDAEATAIANDLWKGAKVKQARLARILWLGVLEFAETSRVLPRAVGKPVYLALAMDAAQRVRLKPQNLVGLPLKTRGEAA